jgi:hypothetical protein
MSVADFTKTENRYSRLHRIFPERAERFEEEAEVFFKERYEQYKKLSEQ